MCSTARAYVELILIDLYLLRHDFAALHTCIRNCPVNNTAPVPGTEEAVCASVDRASIWYLKEVLCLQRSAAAVRLLRKHGIPAHMVIGAQGMPFRAHAWAEVNGRVVNDRPYMTEIYSVLDRC